MKRQTLVQLPHAIIWLYRGFAAAIGFIVGANFVTAGVFSSLIPGCAAGMILSTGIRLLVEVIIAFALSLLATMVAWCAVFSTRNGISTWSLQGLHDFQDEMCQTPAD